MSKAMLLKASLFQRLQNNVDCDHVLEERPWLNSRA